MNHLTFRPLLLCLTVALLAACANNPGVLDQTIANGSIVPPESAEADTGSLFSDSGASLFADIRASRVGDILVVALMERTNAEKNSNTSINKNSSVDVQNPLLAGQNRIIGRASNLDVELDSDHTFSGGSGSDQSNSLLGTVTVTVTRVLAGGNLLVEGEKWISINRGKEYIRLRGIVRPVDIGIDNVIQSTRVANAEITYSGTGETASANAPGWLARFFMGKIWPF